MRVFVSEFTCGEGAASGAAPSLCAEGWAMLRAVLDDLSRVPEVAVVTRLAPEPPASVQAWLEQHPEIEVADRSFGETAERAHATLVIAPESAGVLTSLCREVEARGGLLLGPSSAAVQLAGDKLELSRHLRRHGIPTPECFRDEADPRIDHLRYPAVRKPRDGAGSQATFRLARPQDLARCCAQAQTDGWTGEAILQPFVPGQAASVAFLIGPRLIVPLLPGEQILSDDGRFRYRGGRIPLGDCLAERAIRLGRRAIETIPGLRGFVGVDLILGDAADGSADWVIEVNPRLTTSYVGLRVLARHNLAEAMLLIALGEPIAALEWHPGEITFKADGTCHFTIGGR